MRPLLFLSVVLVASLGTACAHPPSSSLKHVEARESQNFSSITSKGSTDVHVVVGPQNSVEVRCADPSALSRVHTRVDGSELVIDTDSKVEGFGIHFGGGADDACVVDVKLPKLVSVALHGSGGL